MMIYGKKWVLFLQGQRKYAGYMWTVVKHTHNIKTEQPLQINSVFNITSIGIRK